MIFFLSSFFRKAVGWNCSICNTDKNRLRETIIVNKNGEKGKWIKENRRKGRE